MSGVVQQRIEQHPAQLPEEKILKTLAGLQLYFAGALGMGLLSQKYWNFRSE
jgi:hypothetical protein